MDVLPKVNNLPAHVGRAYELSGQVPADFQGILDAYMTAPLSLARLNLSL